MKQLILFILALGAQAQATPAKTCAELLALEFKQKFGLTYLAELRDDANLNDRFRMHAIREGINQQLRLKNFVGNPEALREDFRAGRLNPLEFALSIDANVEAFILYGHDIAQAKIANLSIREVSREVGHGAFAVEPIAAADMIGEYTGILRKRRDREYNNDYIFSTLFPDHIIDAQKAGNATRFINHSSKHFNAMAIEVFSGVRWHVIIIASRNIKAGEQVLIDYGSGYWHGNEPAE